MQRSMQVLLALALALALAATCAAGAARAAEPKRYMVDLSLVTAAGASTPRVMVVEGESFKIVTGEEDAKVSASFTVTAPSAGMVKLAGAVRCADGAEVNPTVIARLGEAATIKVKGPADTSCTLTMTVAEETQPATPR